MKYVLTQETVAGKDLPNIQICEVEDEDWAYSVDEEPENEEIQEMLGFLEHSIIGWTENIEEVRNIFPRFQKPVRVLVSVEGGYVTSVVSQQPTEIVVVDWDCRAKVINYGGAEIRVKGDVLFLDSEVTPLAEETKQLIRDVCRPEAAEELLKGWAE